MATAKYSSCRRKLWHQVHAEHKFAIKSLTSEVKQWVGVLPYPLRLLRPEYRRDGTGGRCLLLAPNAPSGNWLWDQWPASSLPLPRPLARHGNNYLSISFHFERLLLCLCQTYLSFHFQTDVSPPRQRTRAPLSPYTLCRASGPSEPC